MDDTEEKECVCPICEDSGVITTMESIGEGEVQTAPIGSRVCDCRLNEDNWDEE